MSAISLSTGRVLPARRLSVLLLAAAALAAIVFAAPTGPAGADEKSTMKGVKKVLAIARMHKHIDELVDVGAALARGDYRKAAKVAEQGMGIGTSAGTLSGTTADSEVSQAFWEKGQAFRQAASRFAGHARIVEKNNTPEAKAALLDSFAKVMDLCQSCHRMYRDP